MRSFRLRIALLSAALAGSAIAGFSLIAWRLIYAAEVNRLDAKLENLVRRSARPRPPNAWPQFADSLPRELETNSETAIALLVVDENNQILYQSNSLDLQPFLPAPPAFLPRRSFDRAALPEGYRAALPEGYRPPPDLNPQITTIATSSGSWRVSATRFPQTRVAIAVSLSVIDQDMAAIRNIFLIAIPGTLLLVVVGAWIVSGSALRPIRRLTTEIQQVTAIGLDQQVSIESTDIEFVELIQVFNQMLKRLERSFKQASRFSGDAAHELKTPLAILQGELEQALQQAEPGSALQQNLSNLLDEVRRLSGIVRKLLLLSLADAGQMNLYKVEIDLSGMLAVTIEDIELIAPDLRVETDIAAGLKVWGDRDLIAQILQNLIVNAVKYNLPNGWIKLQAERQSETVKMTIANASAEVLAIDRARIFDRFYRGDPARTRKVEGVGLGLSLAREIARAHQGNLTLDDTSAGETAFTLTLPIAHNIAQNKDF
ncbi:HAMP domain-containing protein [Microcoleus sp. FACHB-1515]|uniref:ATP-binding protein n=1 Tax=Leptolyngbya sp. FACHB-1515 TaxID=2933931 RepID=UPI00168A2ABD|nr:HAMP domain-containing protein [Microcoleus sp. FACHB-1515]